MAKPTWFPDNEHEIFDKCNQKYNVTAEMEREFNKFLDTPLVHNIVLCRAKGLNIYNDETGFDVDRLHEVFFRRNKNECQKTWVNECVNTYKDVTSKAEMAFKTIVCLAEKEEKQNNNQLSC